MTRKPTWVYGALKQWAWRNSSYHLYILLSSLFLLFSEGSFPFYFALCRYGKSVQLFLLMVSIGLRYILQQAYRPEPYVTERFSDRCQMCNRQRRRLSVSSPKDSPAGGLRSQEKHRWPAAPSQLAVVGGAGALSFCVALSYQRILP